MGDEKSMDDDVNISVADEWSKTPSLKQPTDDESTEENGIVIDMLKITQRAGQQKPPRISLIPKTGREFITTVGALTISGVAVLVLGEYLLQLSGLKP